MDQTYMKNFDQVTFTTNVMRKKEDISHFSVFSYSACATSDRSD